LKRAPQPKIAKKCTKTPYLGNSKSFKVINVGTAKKLAIVLVMMSSMSMPICNRLYTTQANSGKKITFHAFV